jgi:hypothetical protein
MWRRLSLSSVVCLAAACVARTTEPAAPVTVETFAGTWQSITPSMEFIRLTVASKSSEQGVLGARITFSGVYWDGQGTIDADSLVLGMTLVGAAQPTGTIVARAQGADTLHLSMRAPQANPLQLTLVRER